MTNCYQSETNRDQSAMLFVLGVSESFKGVREVMDESGVESLFVLAKD